MDTDLQAHRIQQLHPTIRCLAQVQHTLRHAAVCINDVVAPCVPCRCIVDDVTSTSNEEQANWAGTLKKALCSVRDHPMRVYDARSLGSLKCIGPAIQEVRRSGLVASRTWTGSTTGLSPGVCIPAVKACHHGPASQWLWRLGGIQLPAE